MTDQHDLKLLLRSRVPVICIESRNERAVLEMLVQHVVGGMASEHLPLFRWTVTDGLQRLDIELAPQAVNSEPADVLGHIRAVSKPGIYVLLDFHPYMKDPMIVRQMRDIAQRFERDGGKLILISPSLEIPGELSHLVADFELSMPDEKRREAIVKEEARLWRDDNAGQRVRSDPKALAMLVRNLAGLCETDVRRLAHNAIVDDGVICVSDVTQVMQAKYKLLNQGGLLSYEYDTARFADVAGMSGLKRWLQQRRGAFLGEASHVGLDAPKGIVLLGVQGCGKSLAAKATAGSFGTPLLRLEFGNLFNKYHGETEKNLRDALQLAQTMAPCVLWIDEMEKALSGRDDNTGTAQRVLGAFLTWMAERKPGVFVVATANDITKLPPELVRKGRFDEIFFVDLPDETTRAEVLNIHLRRRGVTPSTIDSQTLAIQTAGFSGAELEQLVISGFYAAAADNRTLETTTLSEEITRTSPLSVVMAEDIASLRQWANGRTVSANG
ncbi:MAG: AAA family ATPase [Pseudomonadota bacterium]